MRSIYYYSSDNTRSPVSVLYSKVTLGLRGSRKESTSQYSITPLASADITVLKARFRAMHLMRRKSKMGGADEVRDAGAEEGAQEEGELWVYTCECWQRDE